MSCSNSGWVCSLFAFMSFVAILLATVWIGWLFLMDWKRKRSKDYAKKLLAQAGVAPSASVENLLGNKRCSLGRLIHWDNFDDRGVWVCGGTKFIDPWEVTNANEGWFRRFCRVTGRRLGVWPEDMPGWLRIRAGLVFICIYALLFVVCRGE